MDDLANNTTTLDLSGTKLSDLSELDILPNLTEVKLSDNDYGPVFDFSKLPKQITGIDLTGNDIYDYDNLVNVVVEENGNETVTNLHDITKLYLPRTAKDNIKDLVRFYIKNKDAITNGKIDMKIKDESGTLQTYPVSAPFTISVLEICSFEIPFTFFTCAVTVTEEDGSPSSTYSHTPDFVLVIVVSFEILSLSFHVTLL